ALLGGQARERERELAAIAGFVAGKIDAARQRDVGAREARFLSLAPGAVEDLAGDAEALERPRFARIALEARGVAIDREHAPRRRVVGDARVRTQALELEA